MPDIPHDGDQFAPANLGKARKKPAPKKPVRKKVSRKASAPKKRKSR